MQSSRTFSFLDYSPFSKKLEVLNLSVTWIFFILTVLTLAFSLQLTTAENNFISNISEILFVNSFHTIFSLFFFLGIPEFKEFIDSKSKDLGYSIVKIWIALNLFAFGVFWYVYDVIQHSYGPQTLPFFFMMFILLRSVHGTRQTMGISLLYYAQLKQMHPEYTNLTPLLKLERVIGFLATTIVILLPLKLFVFKTMPFWQISLALSALTLAVMIYLLCRLYKLNKEFFKLRLLFLIRYSFLPLMGMSKTAFSGASANHGIEYLLISEKIAKNSKVENSKIFFNKTNLLILVGYAVTFVVYYSFPGRLFSHIPDSTRVGNLWEQFCFSLFLTVAHVHFITDAFIFRFKDPSVQSTIGTIFFKAKKITTT